MPTTRETAINRATFNERLSAFLHLLEAEHNAAAEQKYPRLHADALAAGRRGYHHMGYDAGPKYVKVWSESGAQRSVKYFVEKETGIIWGAAGWKQRNKNRQYGTLETIHDWHWGEYYGRPKDGRDRESATLVPVEERR